MVDTIYFRVSFPTGTSFFFLLNTGKKVRKMEEKKYEGEREREGGQCSRKLASKSCGRNENRVPNLLVAFHPLTVEVESRLISSLFIRLCPFPCLCRPLLTRRPSRDDAPAMARGMRNCRTKKKEMKKKRRKKNEDLGYCRRRRGLPLSALFLQDYCNSTVISSSLSTKIREATLRNGLP